MTVTEVFMPQLGVNDDMVMLRAWNFERGQKVKPGDEVALLETTKATFSLEAESAGYLYPVVEMGREVAVRSVLAVLLDQPDEKVFEAFVADLRKGQAEATASRLAESAEKDVQFTVKARALVEKTGVDVSALPAGRVIRERDVLELLGRKPAPSLHRDPLRMVAVYGASQGGIATVEAIRAMGGYEVAAFLDDTPRLAGSSVFGLPVWSGKELEKLAGLGVGAVASHIAEREFRLQLRDRVLAAGLAMLNVIHPRAYVSPSVRMGVGNVIKAGAIVDTEVQLGDCCIIDNGAVAPHHNVIHDACHLGPGVVLGGACTIGERTLLGVGSKIASRIQIGRNVIVLPGSVVVRDIPDNVLAGGNPAKVVGNRR
jgi:sugar O-acyltransferase (sialic acid O-acetyltransferase NeuD family)